MTSANQKALIEGLSVAALTALLPGAGAALIAVRPLLKMGIDLWSQNETQRQAQRAIADALTSWAAHEGLANDVEPGLAIAKGVLKKHGLNETELRRLEFDTDAAVTEVIRRAATSDSGWTSGPGQERHDPAYSVAERALRATFDALTADHQIEKTVLASIREAARVLEEHLQQLSDSGKLTAGEVEKLVRDLSEPATAEELITYLRQRIADWDVSPWIGERLPSAVERPIMIRRRDEGRRGNPGLEQVLEWPTLRAVLKESDHLVLLGEPGSGKSWLVRRLGRETARLAVDRLSAGLALSDVDIPVLTTWDAWSRQDGDARRSLVDSSFDTGLGHGDLGDGVVTERIKRLLKSHVRVLMIVDSLDESRDQSRVSERMREMESIPGWRTVITSRHGSWDARAATRRRVDGVLELTSLSWQDGAVPFIEEWFGSDTDGASRLIARLASDERMRQMAGVPLLLTFLCMLAQDSASRGDGLPPLRHQLFSEVVEGLIGGEWTSDAPVADTRAARELLGRWAWAAAPAASDAGWGEPFEPEEQPPDALARPISHIAPHAGFQMGRSARRFRHATLQEHMAAMHLTGLDPAETARRLLPFVWFDARWAHPVATAIAAHPRREAVVEELLGLARASSGAPGSEDADVELERRLLDVAEETCPSDWSPPWVHRFHELRARAALTHSTRLARSSHWEESNTAIIDRVMQALPSQTARGIWRLGALVSALHPSDDVSQHVLQSALDALGDADPDTLWRLVDLVTALNPGTPDRMAVIGVVLHRLNEGQPYSSARLVRSTVALAETSTHSRQRLLDSALEALGDAQPHAAGSIATLVGALAQSDADKRHAIDAVMEELPRATPNQAARYLNLAKKLACTNSASEYALHRVLDLLPGSEPATVARLAALGSEVALPGATRPQLRSRLIEGLSTDTYVSLELAAAAASLKPTPEEQRSILNWAAPILETSSNPWLIARLVEVSATLDPGPADRDLIMAAALKVVDRADHHIAPLASALSRLDLPTEVRSRTISAIIAMLPKTRREPVLAALAAALLNLVSTAEEHQDALEALLLAVKESYAAHVPQALDTIAALVSSDDDRRRALDVLVGALAGPTSSTCAHLTDVATDLAHTSQERARVVAAALRATGDSDPRPILRLENVLHDLAQDGVTRRPIRAAVLANLAHVEPWAVVRLLDLLIELTVEPEDGQSAVDALISAVCGAKANVLPDLVDAIPVLATKTGQTSYAVSAVLGILNEVDPKLETRLFSVFESLGTSGTNRDRVRATALATLTRLEANQRAAMVRKLRQLSTFEEWNDWLHGRP